MLGSCEVPEGPKNHDDASKTKSNGDVTLKSQGSASD